MKVGLANEDARRQPTIQDLMRHTAGLTYGNQGTSELHKRYPSGSGPAAETMTGAQFVQALAKLPLHYQPGTLWDYSFGLDVLGVAIESVVHEPLSKFLSGRIFRPLGMTDTGFVVPADKAARIAQPLPKDPITGQPQPFHNPTQPYKFDCGGGCAVSTALDYLRFAQMLLNRGSLDGTRILGRKMVEYMTADQLGADVNIDRLANFPVDYLEGYGFGFGVAVRRTAGVSGVPGSAGEFHWSGSQGTVFWVDPREEMVIVFMAQTPGQMRVHYRQVVPTLVLQAVE
jgi:CubicO group peptidase (beta-lactamase class C family)